jgi:hypothetical protein
MTLPFRRRHHDDEAAHDRARALTSHEMLEPIGDADAAWLAGHLDGCAECRQEREAFLADRELLRSLRDHVPEPPRDLWARTSAALDREARHHPARSAGSHAARRGFPMAPAAAVLVLLVVVGASIVPPILSPKTPGGTQSALASQAGEATPFQVAAANVGWVHQTGDGSWELVISSVSTVCPRQAGCQQLGEDVHGRPVPLGNAPASISISPDEHHLVVESLGEGAAPNKILVVPVPSASPAETPEPVATPQASQTTPASGEPTPPSASPIPSSDIAAGVIEIASGVTVVGETAYSDNGQWLAFSAAPSDGTAGPDLYLWKVGDPSAKPITSNHRTYFSAWLKNQILASTIVAAPDPSATDPASADPANPAPTDATGAPSDTAAPAATEAHAASFLLDPATLARTDIAQPDVWLPVVDPTGHFVTYWSGTLTSAPDGLDWRLATGHVVLDGWSTGDVPTAAASPAATETVSQTRAPEATAAPVGPVGAPMPVVEGQTGAFTSKFDPTGTRLAVWVSEEHGNSVGRLYLYVIDPATGAVDPNVAPLRGVPALQPFSLESGRLAWVSPPGQDGQDSSVQVLGWSHDDFGEIRTIPSKELFIVH